MKRKNYSSRYENRILSNEEKNYDIAKQKYRNIIKALKVFTYKLYSKRLIE